jgi:uncharacterized membrane protein YqiK
MKQIIILSLLILAVLALTGCDGEYKPRPETPAEVVARAEAREAMANAEAAQAAANVQAERIRTEAELERERIAAAAAHEAEIAAARAREAEMQPEIERAMGEAEANRLRAAAEARALNEQIRMDAEAQRAQLRQYEENAAHGRLMTTLPFALVGLALVVGGAGLVAWVVVNGRRRATTDPAMLPGRADQMMVYDKRGK